MRSSSQVIEILELTLYKAELQTLTELCKISNTELRQSSLRNFFHQPEVFSRVNIEIDPSWISYELFLNYQNYEF